MLQCRSQPVALGQQGGGIGVIAFSLYIPGPIGVCPAAGAGVIG